MVAPTKGVFPSVHGSSNWYGPMVVTGNGVGGGVVGRDVGRCVGEIVGDIVDGTELGLELILG